MASKGKIASAQYESVFEKSSGGGRSVKEVSRQFEQHAASNGLARTGSGSSSHSSHSIKHSSIGNGVMALSHHESGSMSPIIEYSNGGGHHSSGYTQRSSTVISGSGIHSSGNHFSRSDEKRISGRSHSAHGSRIAFEKLTREDEKNWFVVLNDRLARYIEIVRNLKMERDDLNEQLNSFRQLIESKTTVQSDSVSLTEMSKLNQKISQVAMEKAEIKLNYENLWKENDELKHRLQQIEGQLVEYAKKAQFWENNYNETSQKLELMQTTQHTRIKEVTSSLESEWKALFKVREAQHHDELVHELQALRADFQARIEKNRMELSGMYKIEFSGISIPSDHVMRESIELREETRSLQTSISTLQIDIQSRESTISSLKMQIQRLEEDARRMKSEMNYENLMASYEASFHQKVAQIKEEMNAKIEKYSYLLDLKIQLDTELQAYHTLLEAEERRLHINQYQVEAKKARNFVTKGHSEVDVLIEEVDMDGRYIRIANQGSEDFHLGSWSITSGVGSDRKTYKFPSGQVIRPEKRITIWSSNRGGKDAPPEHVIMNGVWPSSDRIKAYLFDDKHNEQAFHESWREIETTDVVHHHHHITSLGV